MGIKDTFKAFLENRYAVAVAVGTHPMPQNFLDMHTHLGPWENPIWQPLVAPTMADEEMRLSYV